MTTPKPSATFLLARAIEEILCDKLADLDERDLRRELGYAAKRHGPPMTATELDDLVSAFFEAWEANDLEREVRAALRSSFAGRALSAREWAIVDRLAAVVVRLIEAHRAPLIETNDSLAVAYQEVSADALDWCNRAETAEMERDALAAAIERVRALHSVGPSGNEGPWCVGCDDFVPCRTNRALDATEETR